MHKNWYNIGTVSGWTGISRILGLIRDGLMTALLGTSAVSAGFIIAFTLPNLFRRLLGEGALGSAAMPVLARELESSGPAGFRSLISRIVTRLAVGLFVIWIIAEVFFLIGSRFTVPGSRLDWALRYSTVVFTYIGPVCVAAVLTTGLNLLGRFAMPAFTPVALNLSILGGGLLAILLHRTASTSPDAATAGWYLSAGVALGGLLQLALTAGSLRRTGWRFRFDLTPDPALREVWQLFAPGVAGAAITQVNLLVSRLLAFSLGSAPVAYLYLAARLIELPLGLYAIAVTSVYFPKLSRAAANGDFSALETTLREGLERILWITLPAAVGLILLAEPVVGLLFEWGRFSSSDVIETSVLLRIYAFALPAYAISGFATRALHARRNMQAPLRIAGWNLLINLGLGIGLMLPFGVVGLALGNTIAAWIQTRLLLGSLHSEFKSADHPLEPLLPSAVTTASLLGSATLGAAVAASFAFLPTGSSETSPKWIAALLLSLRVGIGLAIYFGVFILVQKQTRTKKSRSLKERL